MGWKSKNKINKSKMLKLMKHYLTYPKIWFLNSKNFNIVKEKPDGVKDKLKEARFNKMLSLIHCKLYTVDPQSFL